MKAIHEQLWTYAEQADFLPLLERSERGDAMRPPVLQRQHADRNILIPPDADAATRDEITQAMPIRDRHKWFRSMKSSQALAQSVFANLIVAKQMDALNDLESDQRLPAFGIELGEASAQLEYEVGRLGEPRPTSVDMFIRSARRIAVECKFTEAEFGQCSRPTLPRNAPNYRRDFCDGSYTRQRGRKHRCSLSARGITYWHHVPLLFQWKNDCDHRPCPLLSTYQIARNLLSACVRDDGELDVESGHALVLYDQRNESFQPDGFAHTQFQSARNALYDSSLLRSCSWQSLTTALSRNPATEWLADQLTRKYGF